MKNSFLIFFFLLFVSVSYAETEKFYVYSDGFDTGSASGYMGSNNGSSLKVIDNYDQFPFAGKYCVKARCDGNEMWTGFYVQHSGRWRQQIHDVSQFADLKGYTQFVFYARADHPAIITAGFGEAGEDQFVQEVQVGTEWKKYSYFIGDIQLEPINGLFFISLKLKGNIYLDEIYFERKLSKKELSAQTDISAEAINWNSVKVEVKKAAGRFQLYRDGKPYYIKGAGYQKNMYKAKERGVNSVRIWGHEVAKETLDSAYKHGLTVMLGLWVQHERHGFDYDDEEMVKYQILKFRDVILKYKDHPALLMWGVGNEVDLFYKNQKVWNTIQAIAKSIHELDPNHPTVTVTAGLDTTEIPLIKTICPDIDIFGVNSYAEVNTLAGYFRKAGWDKPYVVTEWGPTGNWECPMTSFKIGIEETSTEKARMYRDRYKIIESDSAMCIGSYAFFWGNKQETTPTWFGLFLPDGKTETEGMDELQFAWTRNYPANRAPSIESFLINGMKASDNIVLEGTNENTATVQINDPDNDSISYVWEIMPESVKAGTGGDWEEAPEAMPQLIHKAENGKLIFNTPQKAGPYRLFLYVYDGKNHGAAGNIPFLVR